MLSKGFYSIAAVVFLLSVILFSSIAFANYIDAGADSAVMTSQLIPVSGFVKTNAGSALANVNVTASVTGGASGTTANTTATGSDGNFSITLNITSVGDFLINVSTSNASTVSKLLPLRVRNVSAAAIAFINPNPPFNNGTSFIINVTFDGIPTQAPVVKIYALNGVQDTTWTIANLTPAFNSSTVVQYNITVPAAASGKYGLVVENGVAFALILVKSSIGSFLDIQDLSNSTTPAFSPAETVRLVTKVRDSSGPIITASVIAFITLPNGTSVNTTLSHNSASNGSYTGTFNISSQSNQQTGTYSVRARTTSGSVTLDNSASFVVRVLSSRLTIVKDFFFDFGASSAFQAGGQVSFDFIVSDTATDTDIAAAAGGGQGAINCTAGGLGGVNVISTKNALTNAPVVMGNINVSVVNSFGQNVCRINLTAPSTDGVYSITVNTTVGLAGTAANVTNAAGFFSVQSYILQAKPISSIGSGDEFLHALKPGTNVTFEVSVRNLSAGGAAVTGSSITGIVVTKIIPLNFVGGSEADIAVANYTVVLGTATANPRVTVLIPENKTGPFNLEIQANVGGTIRGTSFYFAKYINGFAFPSGFFGGGPGGPGDGPEGGGGGGTFKCAGTQTFQAKLFDVETNQPAKNVVFNAIKEAREELTGRSVLSLLSINSSTVSDSNGQANISITFSSSGSFSGFHFFILNVTTSAGKFDLVPGGFECRNLIFFPQTSGVGSQSFDVSPTSVISVSITSVKNASNGATITNFTAQVIGIDNFRPGSGGKFYAGPLKIFNLTNESTSFLIMPDNFTSLGTSWPNGFVGMRLRVCDNSTLPTCDTNFAGFRVVSFEAFQGGSGFGGFGGFGSPSSYFPGATVSINISARTNVFAPNATSNLDYGNATTKTGFNISVGLPWEGSLIRVNEANGTLLVDGWNSSANIGFETWQISFVMPSGIKKGFNMITVTVKNYLNSTTDVDMAAQVSKNSIVVPDGEGVQMTNFGVAADVGVTSQVNSFYNTYGINLTILNNTYRINSSSGRVCVRANMSVTRFGPGSQQIQYNNAPAVNVTIMLIDNGTAGTYDFAVINVSGRPVYSIAAVGQQLNSSGAFGGLYARKIYDCGFFEIINSTASKTGFGSGFGGQQSVNTNFFVPFIVKQQGVARPGVTINISQVVKQEDFGGGAGGFGFTGFLGTSSYNVTTADTDSNGVAFVRMTVAPAGSYGLIWRINTSTSDTADFSETIPIEVKAFNTFGSISSAVPRAVTLTRNTSSVIWNTSSISNHSVFNGTWNENSQGALTADANTSFFYIVLRNATFSDQLNALIDVPGGAYTNVLIDDDENMSQVRPYNDPLLAAASGNWTSQITIGQGGNDDLYIDGNRTVDSNTMQLLFSQQSSGFGSFIQNTGSSTKVDVNVTVRVCAETFDRPRKPVINAAVNMTVEKFSTTGPPTTVVLTMYNPFNNSAVPLIYTGPSGCATFNVSRTSAGETGWTSGFPNMIKGTITSGSTENVFVGSVMVGCPSTGSCV